LLFIPLFGMVITPVLYLLLSWQPIATPLSGFETTTLVAFLGVYAGLFYLCLPRAIHRTDKAHRFLFAGVLIGLAARLVLFASDPILENDYFRYLWDGGVLALGENPYRWSPADVLSGVAPAAVQQLASGANGLVEQIGYPHLRTIYPPLAALFFSLAHMIDPWGLIGLRSLYLIADFATLALLLALLRQLGRSPVWVLVYWLNPLAVQMIYNAAHMDVLLLPFLIGALLYTMRRQPVATVVFLILAAGIKLWPALLAPPLLRYAATQKWVFFIALAFFGLGLALVLSPLVLSGPSDTSGLFAFSGEWRKNEMVFGFMVTAMDAILGVFNVLRLDAERLARVAIAGGLMLLSLWPVRSLDDRGLVLRVLMIATGLFIFAPAPYPWYFIWLLPFLTVVPSFAILAWTATLPLYQLRFHSEFVENTGAFEASVVWVEHGIPVMLVVVTVLFRLVRR